MTTGTFPGVRRIRDAADFTGTLGAGQNGYVLTYQFSTNKWVPAAPSGGGGGTTDHAGLINLDYANAAHVGFAGTGVSNTFTQNNIFSADVSVGDDLTVTDVLDVTGTALLRTSVATPLLTSISGDITLNPAGSGAVLLEDATNFRTQTFDSGFPIGGMKIGPTAIAGQDALTIGVIQADEIHTRTFVADEVRVDRGDEYWTKSYGLLAAGFTTPGSIGGTVTITFEDSPALTGAIASANDYVLFRTIDISSGLDIYTSWGQLSSYVDNGNGTQDWTFTLRSGSTGVDFVSGAIGTIFGASGAGYIHLSTIDASGAPYIKIKKWVTNPYTPANHTTYLQLGNLASTGLAAYTPVGFGLFARSVASAGQFIVLDDNGFQIRGANFKMYNGASQTVDIASNNGSLSLGTNVGSGATTGFTFNGTSGNITIGGASYSPTVTIYGVVNIKAGSAGIANLTDANLDNIANGSTYFRTTANQVTGAGRAFTAIDGGNRLVTAVIPASAVTPSGAGLYIDSTHMGYYSGSVWKTSIDNSGNFLFAGSSGANYIQWSASTNKLSGVGGSVEQWYADATDGTLKAAAGKVWLDVGGLNVAVQEFGNTDVIRFMRSGVAKASIGYERAASGGPISSDGMIFRNPEGTKFFFSGGSEVNCAGGVSATYGFFTGLLTSAGGIILRGAQTDALQVQGTTHNTLIHSGSSEHTYIRGGKASSQVYINDTSGLGDVNLAGGGGYVNVLGPAVFTAGTGGTGTTKAIRQYGAGTDGTRFWSGAAGWGAHWNGTNYRTATDGGSNGGVLQMAVGGGDYYQMFIVPNTGGTAQTIAPGSLAPYLRIQVDTLAGLSALGATTETAQGIDNVRLGVLSGTPRVIWEDSGSTQWVIDNSAGLFRLSTPGTVQAVINTSGNMTIGGSGSSNPDWRFNVMSGTGQMSFNPDFSGVNYLSSYIGANTPGPLALFGSRVFVDGDTMGIKTAKTPASAAATGTQGMIAWDSSFIYVCTATNTWKRVAIATW